MSTEISFIIPAYNESRFIASCLKSIVDSCKGMDIQYEIIIVDNGSTDDTCDIAREYTQKIHSIKRSSISTARNYGVQVASYQFLAFIDGDVQITSRWVNCFQMNYLSFRNNPFFLTGSQCIVPQNGSLIERFWFNNINDKFLGGANMITSAKAYEIIGGFDTLLETGEDYDFCLKGINKGIYFFIDKQFEAIHLGFPKTIFSFFQRELWHGKGDFTNWHRFVSSPVALLSVLYSIWQLAIILLAIQGQFLFALGALLLLIVVNFMITYKRFEHSRVGVIVINSIFNYTYFCARFFSLFKVIYNKNGKDVNWIKEDKKNV